MGKLLLLFVLVPLVELYLLLAIGSWLGFWPTIGLVFITGILGASLARRQELRVWRDWRSALARGQMPAEGVLGSVLVLIGGVLLITPGVLTDVMGLLLLIPTTRARIARRLRRWLETRIERGNIHVVRYPTQDPSYARRDPSIIDVEGEEIDIRRHS